MIIIRSNLKVVNCLDKVLKIKLIQPENKESATQIDFRVQPNEEFSVPFDKTKFRMKFKFEEIAKP